MAVQDAIATIVTETPAETEAVGRVLGRALVAGDLVNLQGDLGAGKTLFVKGLAASLGYDPHDVQSPTFTLVHEHRGERLTLYHLDLYRLDDALAEIEALGFEEYLEPEDAVTAVEWGERGEPALSRRRFDVVFEVLGSRRRITVYAREIERERIKELQRAFSELGLERTGGACGGRPT